MQVILTEDEWKDMVKRSSMRAAMANFLRILQQNMKQSEFTADTYEISGKRMQELVDDLGKQIAKL